MQHEEGTNKYEWVVPSEKQEVQTVLMKSLDSLLAPYDPVKNERDSDVQWSTNEIISALEMHYGYSQGDGDENVIDGKELVEALTEKGFFAVNTGGLNLQWLMKKKKIFSSTTN